MNPTLMMCLLPWEKENGQFVSTKHLCVKHQIFLFGIHVFRVPTSLQEAINDKN